MLNPPYGSTRYTPRTPSYRPGVTSGKWLRASPLPRFLRPTSKEPSSDLNRPPPRLNHPWTVHGDAENPRLLMLQNPENSLPLMDLLQQVQRPLRLCRQLHVLTERRAALPHQPQGQPADDPGEQRR